MEFLEGSPRSYKCQYCKNAITLQQHVCSHCGNEISEEFKRSIIKKENQNDLKNIKKAIVVVPLVFTLLYFLFDYLLNK